MSNSHFLPSFLPLLQLLMHTHSIFCGGSWWSFYVTFLKCIFLLQSLHEVIPECFPLGFSCHSPPTASSCHLHQQTESRAALVCAWDSSLCSVQNSCLYLGGPKTQLQWCKLATLLRCLYRRAHTEVQCTYWLSLSHTFAQLLYLLRHLQC